MKKIAVLCFVLGVGASCTYEPGFGDLSCSDEGATDARGRTCQGGFWVGGTDTPDMDLDQPVDMPEPDMPQVDMTDMADMTCEPEADSELCEGVEAQCGAITTTDRCGVQRTVDCGTCTAPEECGAVEANKCACIPETALQFCLRNSKTCGEFTGEDNCGETRTEECGTCTLPAVCGGGGTDNVCACPDQTDQEFCDFYGAECGQLQELDACQQTRLVDCGGCTNPETCGGGAPGQDNICGCTPETNQVFCDRNSKDCGTFNGTDNCGDPRTAECGTCTSPETCGGGASPVANVCACTPESNQTFCDRNGKDCGSFAGTDNCGAARTANCGTCTSPETCGGGASPVANVCACTPESNQDFCDRNGKDCGSFAGTDNCGAARTANCGSCTSPETCGGGASPEANVCACTPESNQDFCDRNGKDCGSFAGTDNCGAARTTNCGSCTSPETCGGGASPEANVCACTPESDQDFCDRNGKDCGSFAGTDNCGAARTASCGNCANANETCGGGDPGEANVCGCDPEAQTDFCERLGVCGAAVTDNDICGNEVTFDCSAVACLGQLSCDTNEECSCTDCSACDTGTRCIKGDSSYGTCNAGGNCN